MPKRKPSSTPTPESPLLSMRQAAEYLGVSLKIIRDLVENKAFKVIPLAGVIKIRKATIDAWLESQEVYRDDDEAFASSGRFKQIGKERDAASDQDED